MPSLRELQRSFAASMLTADAAVYATVRADGLPSAERVGIYRNTFRSTVAGVLQLVYPAVCKVTGEAFFAAAAAAFAAAHPPAAGDLNQYGGGFAEFLDTYEPARSVPYLGDVARFEWALNVAATAPDAPTLDVGALAFVHVSDLASVSFGLHPSVTLLELLFPADHIADAVLAQDEGAMAAIDLAAGPVHLVVWRNNDGVQAQRVPPHSHRLIARLYAGATLEQALQKDAASDAAEVLAAELTQGRFCGYRVVAAADCDETQA